ncbi:TRZ/ATZ family hydrolase [Pelagibaculum spongiae]|uniref:TRZ/ATZ family hydrolase n=1 Tax=Pelagibaculum spongiae TaxID=2080658 RepID=A0A2V1H378_9GAMM|nr:TRZ/ATZ family hydrolase [Pelagibaculum spongiae]PVZ71627.1 TRZ/ATZ family hydrolase [Pelagibaculum spongiae]
MKAADSIIHARWVIPVSPTSQVLENHSLIIQQDKIIDILPSAEAKAQYQSDQQYHLTDHALIPGLVNCHAHAAMSLFRGLADDLPLMSWLQEHIWPAESKFVSPSFVEDGTRLAIAEMLRCGTTCFNNMYFFNQQEADICQQAGIRASSGLPVLEFPTAYASGPDEYFEKGLAHIDYIKDMPLVTATWAPHAPYTVSDVSFEKVAELSAKYQMPIQLHLHESKQEIEDSIKQFGVRPQERLTRTGIINKYLQAVHFTQATEQEIEQLAAAGASMVHCPESNLKLASGFAPIGRLQKAGINIAIGTDGAASNNDLDMIGEMRTAAMLAKAVAEDATALSASEALYAATMGGAKAMHLDDKIGSLEVGKFADIAAINLSDLECQPMYNPISQIVYAVSRHQVSHTWVAGRCLLNERQLTSDCLNQSELVSIATQWRDKIAQ